MMDEKDVFLYLPEEKMESIWNHLLNSRSHVEEAGFVFAEFIEKDSWYCFKYRDWEAVSEKEFASRSNYHFELTDRKRGKIIKKAHDLEASIVELHSHRGKMPPKFSSSDILGFKEFVPHIFWRLEGRPYGALVVSNSGFDGFSWIENPDSPCRIQSIITSSGRKKDSSGLSPLDYESYHGKQI